MEKIIALVEDALARRVGSAVALSIGDGGVEVERGFRGHTRRVPELGEPVGAHTWFDLASLTKPIATVASAMVLAGEGQLDLDAPIRRWIPQAASTGTVRHLLGHASGCIAHVEFFKQMREGKDPLLFADARGELLDLAARVPANPPGLATVYSDLGFIQLGAILERVTGMPLEQAYADLVAGPLGLAARFPGTEAIPGAVATELDDWRGLVCGRVHDDNAYFAGGVCGHAGLFATLADVATFAQAIIETHAGRPRGKLVPAIVQEFARASAAPHTTWRLGFDTPSHEPGVSQAGDRWPRDGAIGHTGFTGTSMWLDLPNRRWVVLLTNRVHPTRGGTSADDIKALRRAVHDAAVDMLTR